MENTSNTPFTASVAAVERQINALRLAISDLSLALDALASLPMNGGMRAEAAGQLASFGGRMAKSEAALAITEAAASMRRYSLYLDNQSRSE